MLTTMAFGHSSLRWFEAYSCKSAPRGLPSSLVQLHAGAGEKKTIHLFALVAHLAVNITHSVLTALGGIYPGETVYRTHSKPRGYPEFSGIPICDCPPTSYVLHPLLQVFLETVCCDSPWCCWPISSYAVVGGIEVAFQFQAKAIALFIDGYSEI